MKGNKMSDRNAFSAGLGAKVVGAIADEDGTPAEANTFAETSEVVRGLLAVLRGEAEIVRKVQTFLRLIAKDLNLKAADGKRLIKDAEKLFTAGIGSNFVNWGLNKVQAATKAIVTEVHQLVKNGTYEQMFKSLGRSLDELVMTQSQILDWVETHRSQLSKNWTFFLLKEGDEYFVVDVHAYSDGRLSAYVYRFSNVNVWDAETGHRLVVPQPQQKLGSS